MSQLNQNSPIIARTAMLANLHISQWTGRKFDRKASDEYTRSKHAEADSARVNKLLISKEALKPIQQLTSEVRGRFYRVTLPWGDNGDRVMPATIYTEFMEFFQEQRDQFTQEVEQFIQIYEREVQAAEKRLGDLFDPNDYPTPHAIADKFGMHVSVRPIPTADDFRLDLSSDVESAVKEQVTSEIQSLTQEAMQHLWGQLREQLVEIRDRLSDPDARFRRALLDNFVGMVNQLDKLNVAQDPELTRLRQEVESNLMALRDPDALRSDKELRQQTADDTDKVIKQFSGLWG